MNTNEVNIKGNQSITGPDPNLCMDVLPEDSVLTIAWTHLGWNWVVWRLMM